MKDEMKPGMSTEEERKTFLEIQKVLEDAGRADLSEVFHGVWVEYWHRHDDLIEIEAALREFRRRNPLPEEGS